ncbi:hypothetical protein P3T76_004646 [Phytophthora citrophthora]|uniref:Crinkler effector protein N-terminal domain-containing protein n=1 Tax=Phytophthora citrophthora TaxID=4793 RepID=A0AAD9LN72_9STRA|nr:hypothetical protein P3T76_004646 [Phytophthora citrophthora]
MLTLVCAVDIDANKSVIDLKVVIKAIFEDIKTPTRCIQLFLAKNRDGWMRDDENLEKMLQKPVDISEMKKMRARMKLNDPELFGSDVSLLGEDVVHVLVFLS